MPWKMHVFCIAVYGPYKPYISSILNTQCSNATEINSTTSIFQGFRCPNEHNIAIVTEYMHALLCTLLHDTGAFEHSVLRYNGLCMQPIDCNVKHVPHSHTCITECSDTPKTNCASCKKGPDTWRQLKVFGRPINLNESQCLPQN